MLYFSTSQALGGMTADAYTAVFGSPESRSAVVEDPKTA